MTGGRCIRNLTDQHDAAPCDPASNKTTAFIMTVARYLLFLTILFGWHSAVIGQDIAELQTNVDAQIAEIESLNAVLAERKQAATRFETDLARLRTSTDELEQQKTTALEALKAQFERFVADPTLDLSGDQKTYGEAFAALQRHQSTIEDKQAEIATTRQQVERIQTDTVNAERSLAELRRGYDIARAERLHRELNVEGDIQVSNTIRCQPDETIAACIERGADAALELAKQRFAERIFATTTEADVVAENRSKASTPPVVIDSNVANSGFSGQGDYFVEFEARMRSEPSQAEACALLNLTAAQCRGAGATNNSAASLPSPAPPDVVPAPPPESVDNAAEVAETALSAEQAAGNHMLTVRSDVYYDEVLIDGTSYGSTRLDVVLPAGEYEVEVRKPGYQSYRRRVKLDRDQTVLAELPQRAN